MSMLKRPLAAALGTVLVLSGCAGAPNPTATTPSSTVATSAGNAGHLSIPRTKVSLRAPEGMQVEDSLPGLARPNSRTSVVVVSQPLTGKTPQQVLGEVGGGFTSEKAKTQGLEFEKVQNLEVAGFPAISATGTQSTAAGTFAKAMVVLATDDSVVFMTGTIEEGDPLSAADLLAVLTDARWNEQATSGDLGFDLTAAPGYERRAGSSSSILFTLGGASGAGVPKLIASPSLGQGTVTAARHRAFAVERFEKLPAAPSADSTSEVKIAGLSGFEMTGRGSRAGETVYCVVLYTDTGYIVIAGDFNPAKHPGQLPAFRTMARSLVIP